MAFELAGRRIGALALNFVRLVVALAMVCAWLGVARGSPLPRDVGPQAALWLAASGLVGFVFGDLCLFKAFLVIGARTALLVMTLVPPITALLGLAFLGESLAPLGALGMALTVGGVAWVVLERRPEPGAAERRRYPLAGILLGAGGAVGQAAGLVICRHVMAGIYPFSASAVRIAAGIVGFAVVLASAGWWRRTWASLRDDRAMVLTAIGSFFGPFLGVGASLAAVRWTDAGTASTLMSIVPVLMIPASILVFKEQVSLRSALGSLFAVAGVACMFA